MNYFSGMKRRPWHCLIVLTLAGVISGFAATREEMYSLIVQRNPFGLNPEPEPVPEQPDEPEPEPIEVNVNLTGFSMRKNVKKVYLMIPPSKEDPNPQYLTMEENERQGSLQVLQIDPEKATVKIRNAGKVGVLSFKTHGLKAAPAPKAAASSNRGKRSSSRRAAISNNNNTSSNRSSGPTIIKRGGTVQLPQQQDLNQSASRRSSSSTRPSYRGNSSGRSSQGIRRTIPQRSSNRTGPNYQHNFTGSGEEVAAKQLITLEAQRQARLQNNPGLRFPPVPHLPNSFQNQQQDGGGQE